MTTLVSRLFASADVAAKAGKALRDKGLRSADIVTVASGHADALAVIRAAGLPGRIAGVLAGKVADGHTLVIVRAPFGLSGRVGDLLDTLGPVDAGAAQADVFVETRDTRPLPPNRALPTLLDGPIFSGRILPHVTKVRTPFSSMFGLPLLSSRKGPKNNLISGSTTPLSSALGLRLLTGGRA